MPIQNKDGASAFKAPKNNIPTEGETIVKSLIYDISYTKSAKERAALEQREPNLFDGLAVKFCHLQYWSPNGERVLVGYDGAASAKDVTFPCDTMDAAGEISYCYITNEEYLNINRITNKFSPHGGYVKPQTEADLLLVYDSSLCSQLGLPGGEIADTILTMGVCNPSDEELARVGIVRPEIAAFPIVNVYRYRDARTAKDGKKESKWVLTGYNRTAKANDLGGADAIEWLPASVGYSIAEALAERQIRKANKEPF